MWEEGGKRFMASRWLRGNALRAKWLKGNGLRPRGWCGAGEIETEIEIEWIGGEAAKGTQPPLFRGEGDHEVVARELDS